MAGVVELANDRELYEADEHAWIERQIVILQQGNVDQLDRDSLIEFLTSMANRDRRELRSRLTVLYTHILKYSLQPEKATRSWRLAILEQQREIRALLEESATLAKQAADLLRRAYPDAMRAAVAETGVTERTCPPEPEHDVVGLLAFDAPPFGDLSILPRPE